MEKVKRIITLSQKMMVTGIAVIASLFLPQIVHLLGVLSSTGNQIALLLLPMHFAVILCGLLCGPIAGLAAGVLSTVLNHLLFQMPALDMLPFMLIEVAAYGFFSGLFFRKKFPSVFMVLFAQIAGRVTKAAAIAIAFYAFSFQAFPVLSVWTATVMGLTGIILQLIILPLLSDKIKSSKLF
jgi:hypothetical protein